MVRAADWIIDLGPEGGDAGGERGRRRYARRDHAHRRLAYRPRAHRCASPQHAGRAVRDSRTAQLCRRGARAARAPAAIEIRGAREHNLKNVDVNLGLNQFTVITGVSGSGKSTLAFDILFAEGQRRYLESLNAYARQFVQPASRPDVDAIFGIPPTVAIEQRTSRGGHKSTVATLTEIYHFLRLLYVKLGVQYCPICEARIEPQSADAIAARLLKDYRGKSITLLAPLIVARKGLYTALAKWARGKGFRASAGRRQACCRRRNGRGSTASSSTTSNCPSPRSSVSAAREAELREALGPGACSTAAAWCTSTQPARAASAARGVLDQARLPELRHRLSGTRPAAVLLQLEARLVQELLRHRAAACRSSMPSKAARNRSGASPPDARRVRRACPRLRAATSESGGAARAVPRPVDRRAHRPAGAGILRAAAEAQIGRAASATSRATCWPSSPPAPPFSATWAWAICS